MLAAIVSALHVLALAVGLPAVLWRGRALKGPLDDTRLERLFAADTAWGIAGLVWVTTGLLRAFGGLEKGSEFYLRSLPFWTKMGLLLGVLALEVWPMTAFIRWRIERRRGRTPDTSRAWTFYVINHVQMALVVVMVFVASFMARGFGLW